jgi:hypothetical protein
MEAYEALLAGIRANPVLREGNLDHVSVEISGGLDSRLTAGTLAEVFGEIPLMITLDIADSHEVEIAGEVARQLGADHRIGKITDGDEASLRTGWLLTSGQVSTYKAADNIVAYKAATSGQNDGQQIVVGGWRGDSLIGSFVPLRSFITWRCMGRILGDDYARKRGRDWLRSELSGTSALKVARNSRRKVVDDLRRTSGFSAAHRITYWAQFVRQPAFNSISPARLTSNVLEVTPLISQEYVNVLMGLTGKQLLGKNFYRAMITQRLPDLAAISNVHTGIPVNAEYVRTRVFPNSFREAYRWSPRWLRRYARRLIAAVEGLRHVEEEMSNESEHWLNVLEGLRAPRILELAGLSIRPRPSERLHIQAVALGAEWTKSYLERGFAALGE